MSVDSPSKAQMRVLEVLASGGRLFESRWGTCAPWLYAADGYPAGHSNRATLRVMRQSGWIAQGPVLYGSGSVEYRITVVGGATLAAATTTAPAADTDAAAETVGEGE